MKGRKVGSNNILLLVLAGRAAAAAATVIAVTIDTTTRWKNPAITERCFDGDRGDFLSLFLWDITVLGAIISSSMDLP